MERVDEMLTERAVDRGAVDAHKNRMFASVLALRLHEARERHDAAESSIHSSAESRRPPQ